MPPFGELPFHVAPRARFVSYLPIANANRRPRCRLFAIKENARNRCDLVSDKIGVTAKRLSGTAPCGTVLALRPPHDTFSLSTDDGRQAVIKLNFLRKGDFAHRLFYLTITLVCENANVELKSTLFKVATKPSRVILRNVPETWTRDDIVSHYPELGARGNNAEAPEVQMDDLGAHAARGAGAGTATGRRGRSAGGHSPPGVERRESVDESKSDAESVHSSTSSRHVIDSIISDLGEPRGVYLLNFRTSTLCVQFFTANYADLSSKGISAFLAPKRHYKIGRDLHHRSEVVVDSFHHGARSPRNQPFDGFTAEMINPPRAQHAEPASPAHVADAAAATPLPAAHIPQTSMYPQAHYAALLQGPLRHAMAPLQRALPYSILMGAAQQQQQQQQLLWALTYPDLVEMARAYGLPGWPMPLPRMMPSARAAGLPITSVAHATTAAALSMPMSIRAPAARPPSASAGPIAGTPTSSFARSAFAVGLPVSGRLQSDATLAQLAAGRQLGGSPRPSTMGAGAGASRRVPKRGRSADDAPRARASKMSRTHGPSGPDSPSR